MVKGCEARLVKGEIHGMRRVQATCRVFLLWAMVPLTLFASWPRSGCGCGPAGEVRGASSAKTDAPAQGPICDRCAAGHQRTAKADKPAELVDNLPASRCCCQWQTNLLNPVRKVLNHRLSGVVTSQDDIVLSGQTLLKSAREEFFAQRPAHLCAECTVHDVLCVLMRWLT